MIDFRVNSTQHFCDATEVLGLVDAEEEVDFRLWLQTLLLRKFEVLDVNISGVEDLVASLCGAPDVVLDGLVDVFLRVGLDDEEATVAKLLGARNRACH